ncbi:unnamed protein product, partial [Musa textilis]
MWRISCRWLSLSCGSSQWNLNWWWRCLLSWFNFINCRSIITNILTTFFFFIS